MTNSTQNKKAGILGAAAALAIAALMVAYPVVATSIPLMNPTNGDFFSARPSALPPPLNSARR